MRRPKSALCRPHLWVKPFSLTFQKNRWRRHSPRPSEICTAMQGWATPVVQARRRPSTVNSTNCRTWNRLLNLRIHTFSSKQRMNSFSSTSTLSTNAFGMNA